MAQEPPGESKKSKIKMSKTKAPIAIVDDDESVWRACKSFAGINVFSGKENIRARVVWLDDYPNDAIKEGENGRSRSYHVPFTGNSRRLWLWTDAKLGGS